MTDYTFRTVRPGDLPLLRFWLGQGHLRPWWGTPWREIGLLTGDMDRPTITLNLALWQGRPVGFVQDYDVRDWPGPHLAHLPPGIRMMDVFAGVAGRGHGARFLRARASMLLAAGARAVMIDPEPRNQRAFAAYIKAGFREERRLGGAVLMRFDPGTAAPDGACRRA